MAVLSSGKSFLQGNPFCTSSFRFRWKKTGQNICVIQNEGNVYKQSDIWESNNEYQIYSLLGHDTVQFGNMTLYSLVDSTKFSDSCCLHIHRTTQAQVAAKQNSVDRG